jgi:hypothetical protein
MKSGYGVNLETEPYIRITAYHEGTRTTNTNSHYAPSATSYVAAPQYIHAYFPEFNFSRFDRQLEYDNGKYVFKQNVYSTYNSRVHYTPWWYPDNVNYEIITKTDCAYTPVGRLNIYGVSNSIVIEGNLFDDWHVAVIRD